VPAQPATTGATTIRALGSLTFFYTNAQSGRLMFYHDHAWGTTRLNVYAGGAAGYLLHDGPGVVGGKTTLDDLIGAGIPNNAGADATTTGLPAGLTVANGGLYHFGIPLIIQDKTFVPPATAQGTVLNASLSSFPAGQLTPRIRPGTGAPKAISGSRMSTCRTRTRTTMPEHPSWAVGTTVPGSGRR
jgi:hypothetical protein